MLNQKGANLLVRNLRKAGVKVVGKTAATAAKLAPLVGALALYSDLEKVPGLGQFLKFTREAQQWVYDHSLGAIPVLGWFTNSASDKLEDLFGVSHPTNRVYSGKPGDDKGQPENPDIKEENNDATWYGDVSLPVNINRPIGWGAYQDVLYYPTQGAVPKLNQIVVKMFEFEDSPRFNANISYLFEAMRKNLKSNLTYTTKHLKVFILNNYNLYIAAKCLERRLGFMKFKDPQFPEFHELWQYKPRVTDSYGVYDIVKNDIYDISSIAYSTTLSVYKDLCNTIYNCILPSHLKAWIDHYFGSVFILDDDVMNKKYSYMLPDEIKLWGLDGSGNVIITDRIPITSITPSSLYSLVDQYFNTTTVSTMRGDIVKMDQIKEKITPADFAEGWLQSLDNYNPTVVSDPTYKQLVINGYTSASAKGINGAIRIDSTTPGLVDVLTTVLGLGAMFEGSVENTPFKVKGLSILNSSIIIYADAKNEVRLPGYFQQQAVIDNYPDIVKTAPFQMVYTTDVSADEYITVNNVDTSVTDKRVYYPSIEYPTAVPTSTERTIQFNGDAFSDGVSYDTYNDKLVNYLGYGYQNGNDLRAYIPLFVTNANYMVFLRCKHQLTNTSLIDATIANTSDLLNNFDVVWMLTTDTYTGTNGNFYNKVKGDVVAAELDMGMYNVMLLPNDFTTLSTSSNLTILNSRFSMEIIIPANSGNMFNNKFAFNVFQGSRVTMAITDTFSSATSIEWVEGGNVMYPSSSLTQEYIVTQGTITTQEISVVGGFDQFAEILFTQVGYSIPVRPTRSTHYTDPDTYKTTTVTYQASVLKEDYIPYIIRDSDLPAIWNDMLNTLTSFNVK